MVVHRHSRLSAEALFVEVDVVTGQVAGPASDASSADWKRKNALPMAAACGRVKHSPLSGSGHVRHRKRMLRHSPWLQEVCVVPACCQMTRAISA